MGQNPNLRVEHVTPDFHAGESGEFDAAIQQLSDDLADELVPKARIEFPENEQLTVRLVNIESLSRLEQCNSDVALFQNGFYCLLGASLGILGNILFSSSPVPTIGWVVFSSLAVLCLGSGFLWARYSKRASAAREAIFVKKGISRGI